MTLSQVHGALLVNKHAGVSSFGIVHVLRQTGMRLYGLKRAQLPKIGHGGTLDPFATGLLMVLVGRAVKLAQHFLGAPKRYRGVMRFGETTPAGDPTQPVSQTTATVPGSIEDIQSGLKQFMAQPYWQTPPMYSAKKRNGKALYHLARAGIEVAREPKLCALHEFSIQEYQAPCLSFQVHCASGTYIRTLAQDFAQQLQTLALLESLHRTDSGAFSDQRAWTTDQIAQSGVAWNELPCWMSMEAVEEILFAPILDLRKG